VALAPVYDIVTVTAYLNMWMTFQGLLSPQRRSGRRASYSANTAPDGFAHCGSNGINVSGGADGNNRNGTGTCASSPMRTRRFREIGKRMLTEWEQARLDITPAVTAKVARGADASSNPSVSLMRQTAQGQKKAVLPQSRRPLSHKSR